MFLRIAQSAEGAGGLKENFFFILIANLYKVATSASTHAMLDCIRAAFCMAFLIVAELIVGRRL